MRGPMPSGTLCPLVPESAGAEAGSGWLEPDRSTSGHSVEENRRYLSCRFPSQTSPLVPPPTSGVSRDGVGRGLPRVGGGYIWHPH
jgi:hypothetical protein